NNLKNIIRVSDTKKALIKIATYYRSLFKIPVIGITGSVGKTTTKDMIASVLSQKYNVLKTSENLNNEIGVSKTILNLDDKHDVAVIEMGMCNFGEISELSEIIKPDIGVVTNIGVTHIEALKTKENIFKAKLEILDGMEKDSILILNKDSDFLCDYKNNNYNIKYFGLKNKNANICAENIDSNLETSFDIVDGETKTRIKIPCLGEHSVYSALCAYLVAKQLDLSNGEIINGLSLYSPSGMRQKIVNFKDVVIIEDCYNASPDSMKAAVKTLDKININKNNLKILVISDMLELGDISEKSHYDIGSLIARSDINKLYCFGPFSKKYRDGALDFGMSKDKIKYFENQDDLNDLVSALKSDIKSGNIIWFKASRGMKLEKVLEKIYKNL
ncbi:MAG: UDP-N-acetylmuramoyl-tripeptide--D-alanyl-D-alanine ligase, partial [Oscillospiraceae bacterium]|nr:UDP-N-acetylmuramoyl-tripeptide--D-alanyl-D-alanine ligase [Oscillospiraceae bacterium]